MSEKIDLLDRGEFIDNTVKIVEQLAVNKKGCCFAIEGAWGTGKSFVIEEIEKRLKEKTSGGAYTDKYFVFHYNCWQYDYYEEPSVAIISAMLTSMKEDESLFEGKFDDLAKASWDIAKDKLKEIAGAYVENKIGINIISYLDDIDNKSKENRRELHEFDKMFSFNQTMVSVREKIEKIAEERTIVFFVDELDRCVPQYAIRVLERLHHIFEGLKNVVVIMAIDRKQLEYSVEEMFGKREDDHSVSIEKYLTKFIDFSLVLDTGIINKDFRNKYKEHLDNFFSYKNEDIEVLYQLLSILFKGIDIRRQEKIIEKTAIVHSILYREKVDISVLLFEIMYETWKTCGEIKMSTLAIPYADELEQVKYEEININQIDNNTSVFMFMLHKDAYCDGKVSTPNGEVDFFKNLKLNLNGKTIFYFANLFGGIDEYNNSDEFEEQLKMELMVVKKYCEFSELIR